MREPALNSRFDQLCASAAGGAFPAAPIHHLRVTDSTMDRADERRAAGDPHGTVVIAEYQSGGRGRGERRSWTAPPGSSVLCTVLLRSESMPRLRVGAGRLGLLPLVAGLAVAEAVEELCNVPVFLKWPNDLYLRDRKLSGILCRYRDGAFLVGIGVNCNQRSFPQALRGHAVALREVCGAPVARYVLLGRILGRLRAHTADEGVSQATQLAAVNRRLYLKGEMVSFRTVENETVVGAVVEVGESGSLVLDLPHGGRRRYLSGEIVLEALESARFQARERGALP